MLHLLHTLKYRGQTIKVIESAATCWERVAMKLHFKRHVIDTLISESHGVATKCCHYMFMQWLEGDGRKPITWRTLINALSEAKLDDIAQSLRDVFHMNSSTCGSLNATSTGMDLYNLRS